ncbi:MAG: cell division protein FtsA [Hallerella sp.]|nr:cell division protein FtsA [Fibrobacter sp.]MDY6369733.1 cell division protein FtsA [Fibrobacter sp.]MEE3339342.1 cell division protein FtsA [Hallerella sp.]
MAKEEENIEGIDPARTIVGLDIGSSKIGVFIGQIEDNNKVRVLGFGNPPLKKGDANELEATIQALKKAVGDAELSSGVDVKEVYVGVAGSNIRSVASQASIPLREFNGVVTKEAMKRVVEQASQLVQRPVDMDIIHVLPGDYVLDERGGIKNPQGMEGTSLSVEVQLVLAQKGIVRNISKAVEGAELTVKGLVLEPLADACCVLENDEKELGVAIVDIGATSTDVAVFKEDKVVYTVSFDIAGNAITSDIAIGLTTPMDRAEEIKKMYGTCRRSNLLDEVTFTVPGIGGRPGKDCSRKHLAYIIYCRMNEILMKVHDDLKNKGFDGSLGAGIVITGGTSLLEGTQELAEKIFERTPVRLGAPRKPDEGFSEIVCMPTHSTGVGLLYYAAMNDQPKERRETRTTKIVGSVGSKLGRILNILKNYI